MQRESTLELLQANHTFPGPFRFRVVVRTGATAGVLSAIGAAAGTVSEVEEKPSRKGTYVSVRVTAQVDSAEQVMDVYEVLASLDEVLATL